MWVNVSKNRQIVSEQANINVCWIYKQIEWQMHKIVSRSGKITV